MGGPLNLYFVLVLLPLSVGCDNARTYSMCCCIACRCDFGLGVDGQPPILRCGVASKIKSRRMLMRSAEHAGLAQTSRAAQTNFCSGCHFTSNLVYRKHVAILASPTPNLMVVFFLYTFAPSKFVIVDYLACGSLFSL